MRYAINLWDFNTNACDSQFSASIYFKPDIPFVEHAKRNNYRISLIVHETDLERLDDKLFWGTVNESIYGYYVIVINQPFIEYPPNPGWFSVVEAIET